MMRLLIESRAHMSMMNGDACDATAIAVRRWWGTSAVQHPARSTMQDLRSAKLACQEMPPACGFKLANDGHDTRSLQAYLGHKNIQHTVRYTELAPTRFKDFWRR